MNLPFFAVRCRMVRRDRGMWNEERMRRRRVCCRPPAMSSCPKVGRRSQQYKKGERTSDARRSRWRAKKKIRLGETHCFADSARRESKRKICVLVSCGCSSSTHSQTLLLFRFFSFQNAPNQDVYAKCSRSFWCYHRR